MTASERTTETGIALEVDGLVKRFGGLTAVDGVSLTVRAGECLGLLGPNGAGKSTLIRSMVGRVHQDSGRVTVVGKVAGSTEARMALDGFRRSCRFIRGLRAGKIWDRLGGTTG